VGCSRGTFRNRPTWTRHILQGRSCTTGQRWRCLIPGRARCAPMTTPSRETSARSAESWSRTCPCPHHCSRGAATVELTSTSVTSSMFNQSQRAESQPMRDLVRRGVVFHWVTLRSTRQQTLSARSDVMQWRHTLMWNVLAVEANSHNGMDSLQGIHLGEETLNLYFQEFYLWTIIVVWFYLFFKLYI